MKKNILAFVIIAVMAFGICLSGCAKTPEETYDPKTDASAQPYLNLSEYYGECTNGGKVDTLTYNTESYAVEEQENLEEGSLFEEKKLYVYTPYGYASEKKYNVLYLMHGSNETADYWFYTKKTTSTYYRKVMGITESTFTMNYTKNVVDNLIDKGKCEPFIIVAPSYYSTLRSETAYGSSLEELSVWLAPFEKELRNNIIPLVESSYSTYADGDTSTEGIKASRSHRAIAGFSRGARLTTKVGLNNMLDVFSSFGCFHGCQDTTVSSVQSALSNNPDCTIVNL